MNMVKWLYDIYAWAHAGFSRGGGATFCLKCEQIAGREAWRSHPLAMGVWGHAPPRKMF